VDARKRSRRRAEEMKGAATAATRPLSWAATVVDLLRAAARLCAEDEGGEAEVAQSGEATGGGATGKSRGRRSRLAGGRRSGRRRRGGGCTGGGGAGDGGARSSLGWGRLKHPPRMRLSGGCCKMQGSLQQPLELQQCS
jgi:hypothetical protein